jgi:uncharacterized damage-inducible protein DinB
MTTRVETAWNEIRLAREYTLRLIDGLPESDWFRMPSAGVSHIGWQLGHLAMAQYRLVLDRLRGERPEDAELIAPELLVKFGKGSTPEVDASGYPSPQEILAVLGRVYAQSERELATFPDVDLDSPPLKPHPLFNTKLGSLFWCCRHEMLHAGQIGLLRRQLGHAAKW